MKTILSLCDWSGNWSRPYREAGYNVVQVDLQHGLDVVLLKRLRVPIHGVLAAPPCTHFSRAGAWMWKRKGNAALREGLQIVDACLRMVAIYQPAFWALENPIGRLQDYLGPPVFKFDPWEFGDNWTKRTWVWGNFTIPDKCPCARPALVGKPESRDRTTVLGSRQRNQRSITPMGFARAFFEANQ